MKELLNYFLEILAIHKIEAKIILREIESHEYCAHELEINCKKIKFRISKITPTKVGQFVTIWKRNMYGITAPFDSEDNIDFVIILSKFENKVGAFIFPKDVLIDQKIISNKSKDGKRGIRVYAEWDKKENRQAIKTKKWMNNYFIELNKNTDFYRLKTLLSI